jgi:glycosyltransferase involved in cell wall biosynthesis
VEHIVIDGGSTDGSQDVLRSLGRSAIWTSNTDRGQSDALNRAFAASHGDIIGWLNSDDAYFGPTVVASVVELFVRRPDVDVIYGHAALVNAEGLLLQLVWAPPFSRRLLRFQTVIVQPAAFIRRSALKGRFIDESYDYSMDLELWLRLSSTCKFARLPMILAIDRHHPGRKGETMRSVARVEGARLRKDYGLVSGPRGLVGKLWRVGIRVWGLSLIRGARQGPFAFSAVTDGALKLVARQVAVPRRRMPGG